ncbi:MAG: single-stranded-DNA-specific exonuclease RecJ, partial [Burkholderiales bacterium]|nr:single-stranded-DNA-specific exonuclease RecJ [Burkholderiales bacterium]
MPEIVERPVPDEACAAFRRAGVDAVLARVFAARGVQSVEELDLRTQRLLAPDTLHGLERMAQILAEGIERGQRLLIVGDYDCDGATACAVGVLALRGFGARVDYLVPNRFEFGYGLTPEIVRVAARSAPDILITVDNGIASVEGVREANAHGIRVLITDHHLPGECLPQAACIVNPNQPACRFPSKHLAGVGVMFYAMLALRSELRRRGAFASRPEPNLAGLLDLVALGTIADVVRLDHNNRVLVEQGLRRVRAGRCRPGIRALLEVAGRNPEQVCAHDLGFLVAPRINAAGRLTDIALGIECLLSEDDSRARTLAQQLHELNRERRSIEADMQAGALAHLEEVDAAGAFGLALYHADWHQGIIGILAARLRERFHRPAIVFASGGEGELKGSGRSIAALHLRDAVDLLDKRHPGLILRFGGHAAAAGLAIRAQDFDRFQAAFDDLLRELLTPADLHQCIETDGPLQPGQLNLDLAESIRAVAWGQGFPPPRFVGDFRVLDQRTVGGAHRKLRLAPCG